MSQKHLCSSPARLHFGLLTVGQSLEYRYGGAGLMIDGANTIVEAEHSNRLEVSGCSDDVARKTIEHWYSINQTMLAADFGVNHFSELPIRIQIIQTSPRHSGFGSGTQLALSVVAAAMQCLGLSLPSSEELAIATGRGQRSAIGSHGFRQGGFLVDRGISTNEQLAPLDLRIDFPVDWPIVTILPDSAKGVSGSDEKTAFQNLPASTPKHRQRMTDLLKTSIVPAIIKQDYDVFADGIFEYGHQSGSMFDSIQGGPYNGPAIENVINLVREFGVTATGQSSWGPCVFAILPTQPQADELIDFLRQRVPPATQIDTWLANNQGMNLTTRPTAEPRT